MRARNKISFLPPRPLILLRLRPKQRNDMSQFSLDSTIFTTFCQFNILLDSRSFLFLAYDYQKGFQTPCRRGGPRPLKGFSPKGFKVSLRRSDKPNGPKRGVRNVSEILVVCAWQAPQKILQPTIFFFFFFFLEKKKGGRGGKKIPPQKKGFSSS